MGTTYGVTQEFVQSQSIGLFGKRYVGYFNDDFDFFTADKEYDTGRVFLSIDNFSSSANTYSWMWLGYFVPPTSGDYTFYTNSDGSSWMWVGEGAHRNTTVGNAVVNNSGVHSLQEVSGTKYLRANKLYPVKILFGDNTSASEAITVSFSGPSISKTTDGRGYFLSGPYLFESLYNTTTRTYPANGYEPDLVLDFENNYYRVNGEDTTFANALTHSRTSNATMVDSDGLIKWAPHNFMREDWNVDPTNTGKWLYANISNITFTQNVSDPFGGTSALRVVSSSNQTLYPRFSLVSDFFNKPSRVSAWIRSSANARVTLAGNSSAEQTFTTTTEWTLYTTDIFSTGSDLGNGIIIYAGEEFEIFGYHIHRADLGGMVNNPDTGNSYVPTSGSAVYLPRIGHHVYDGTSWVNEGVLIESEARVNLIEHSILNTNWNLSRVIISENVPNITDPIGNETFSKLSESTDSGVHHAYIGSFSSENTYTISVFAKSANEGRYLQIGGFGLTANVEAPVFDLDNGTVNTNFGTVCTNAGIEDWGNGIYRCWATVTPSLGSAVYFSITNSNTLNGNVSYQGDGTSGVYIWGAQLEEGSTPSSYIPTNGASATRAAETLELPASGITYDVAGITLAVITRDYAYTNSTDVISIDGSGDERTTISWNKSAANDLYRIAAGSATVGYGVQSVKFTTVASFEIDSPAGILAYIRPAGLLPYYNGVANFNQANVLGVPVYDEPMKILTSPGSVKLIRMWKDDIESEGRVEASTP